MPSVTHCALSVCTAPVLVVLLAGAAWQRANQTLGQWAQEVFRGERLPVLTTPVPE
ncbi:MAG: hypothetical protein RMI89_02725 [Gloeomargarita sp. SKYBB_i_bin120]|nr:hypothetical protein [Gloeomargarita sp. SKYG98]MCS7291874.1 hypothetical protein [Gloeomargarita sp. SKYB120]MDW8177434.1 hypothetical protein [Gloeomargarita sp. SKYBB_i_bin120]